MMTQSRGAVVTTRQALAVQQAGPGSYTATIPPDHCYGKDAHGGFQVSLVQCALQKHFTTELGRLDQPHTIDLHASFLRHALAGAVEIAIQDTKLGSTTSTVRFNLLQNGKECLTGFASNANILKQTGPSYETRSSLSPPPPALDFARLDADEDPNWVSYRWPWSDESHIKAAMHARRFVPIQTLADASVTEFWSCLEPAGEAYTNELLGSVIDTYPRMIETMRGGSNFAKDALVARGLRQRRGEPVSGDPGHLPWAYPTLSMGLEIKRLLPTDGVKWLYLRARARGILNGRFDTEVLVYDTDMHLVAVSHQVNFIFDVSQILDEATKSKELKRGKL